MQKREPERGVAMPGKATFQLWPLSTHGVVVANVGKQPNPAAEEHLPMSDWQAARLVEKSRSDWKSLALIHSNVQYHGQVNNANVLAAETVWRCRQGSGELTIELSKVHEYEVIMVE